MKVLAGIVLLIGGVIAPLVMLLWLSGRLNRKPAPRPVEVTLLLAFNGVLPVAAIIEGLRLLSARVGASPVLRIVVITAGLASVVLLVALVISTAMARQIGEKDGG